MPLTVRTNRNEYQFSGPYSEVQVLEAKSGEYLICSI